MARKNAPKQRPQKPKKSPAPMVFLFRFKMRRPRRK